MELMVEDSGEGIPAAERERIFERFYHNEKNPNDKTLPGCGLGLTIVSHVANLHGAQVSVADSSFDQGTAFKVSFPGKEL